MSLASPHAVAFAPPRSRLPQACPPPESGSVADAVRGEVVLDLALRHAGARRLPVRYELAGARGAPVVLVAGGISADRHAAASDSFDAPATLLPQPAAKNAAVIHARAPYSVVNAGYAPAPIQASAPAMTVTTSLKSPPTTGTPTSRSISGRISSPPRLSQRG